MSSSVAVITVTAPAIAVAVAAARDVGGNFARVGRFTLGPGVAVLADADKAFALQNAMPVPASWFEHLPLFKHGEDKHGSAAAASAT